MMKNSIFLKSLIVVMVLLEVGCKNESHSKLSSNMKIDQNTVEQNITANKTEPRPSNNEKSVRKGNLTGKLPAKTFRISDASINGVKAGMDILNLRKELVRAKINVGGSRILVYRIIDDKGGALGYVTPRIGNTDLVGDITLTSNKVLSQDGIRIGDKFEKLWKMESDLKITKADTNGKTYVQLHDLLYRIDVDNTTGTTKFSDIDLATKITEIVIKDIN